MRSRSIHRRVAFLLQGLLLLGALASLWQQQWMPAAITLAIVALTLLPLMLEKRFGVFIPAELEALAIAFVFASLFLGEVRGYYTRFWWWDIALHTSSGFLLGIVGFLMAHVLNEVETIGVRMKPGFVASFAFLFSLGIGALWEVFEFSMDRLAGTNMQKPMLGDPSGLTDTMWDLIVDAVGALVIAVLGYGYLRTAHNRSFLERWIHDFVRRNPRFFRHLD